MTNNLQRLRDVHSRLKWTDDGKSQRERGGGGETLSLSHHHVHQRDHTTLSIPRRSNTFVVIAQQQYKDTGYN